MKIGKNMLIWAAASLFLLCTFSFAQTAADSTPVALNGKLQVDGSKIVGEHGNPVQLMGMSHYWTIWGPQKYCNRDVVSWLVEDWKIDLIRVAMAANENSMSWVQFSEYQEKLVDSVVQAAVDNGIYVIVDWHTHDLLTEEAKEFFGAMAEKYSDCPNIIWEIFNEPTDQTWDEISEYAQEVTAVIREHSDNLILVGTRSWCQRVDEPSLNPLPDENTAYVLHFYAGSHGSVLRRRAQTALENGVALFISEWGTTSADGGRKDTTVYKAESDEWIIWALDNDISMANWSIADLSESSAVLVSGATTNGGWDPETQLSESGKYIRDWIRDVNTEKYGDGPVRLVIKKEGPGDVVVSPEKEEYQQGDTVTLKAIADEDALFLQWQGSASGTEDSVILVMNSTKRVTANFFDLTAPLITNGDFSRGDTSWNFYVHGSSGAEATMTTEDNQARVEIADSGEVAWNVQFFQGDIVLVKDFNYQLTFDAKADSPRDIVVSVKRNGSPYDEFRTDTISLTTEMETFTMQFRKEDELCDDARIEFNFGEFSSEAVTVTNVDFKTIDKLPIRRIGFVKRMNHGLLTINHRMSAPVLDISFDTDSHSSVLKIMDLRSRVIRKKNVAGVGTHKVTFDISKHPAGVYFVVLENAGGVISEKLLLTK
ncbi:MAG: cellulase family glycosylhydrolase [Chitinispirillaceae bacterium]